MSLLTEIIRSSESEEISPLAKQSAHLLKIVQALGWDSFADPRTIKPNLRAAQRYLHKNADKLATLFSDVVPFSTIKKENLIDALNPMLIQVWHVQIIGTTTAASLELLQKI